MHACRLLIVSMAVCGLIASPDAIYAQVDPPWSDDFEAYNVLDGLSTQSAWQTWNLDPRVDALVVMDQARSGDRSVRIAGDNGPFVDTDLIMRFNNVERGRWTLTLWQYVPSWQSGNSYILLLSKYSPNGHQEWLSQIHVNAATGMITVDFDGRALPLIVDAWVELRVEMNVEANALAVFYGGEELMTGPLCNGMSCPPEPPFAAFDLYANFTNSVYYDDGSLSAGRCCTGDERIKARCRPVRDRFKIKATLKRGLDGCPVELCLDDRPCAERTTDDRGRAKAAWKTDQPGEHEITAETESCGTPAKRFVCAR